MRGILIGAIHKKGTFTDDSNFVQGVGYTIANDCKCAWSERGNVFGKDVSMKDIGELVGTEIQYFYNDKKKLEAVII